MAQTEHPNQQQQVRRKRWPWIIGAAVVVIGVASYVTGDASGDAAGARVACENLVSDRLVSPSSADFSRPDVNELAGSGDAYRVVGFVDADNRLGASMRIDYECKVRHTGGDEWSLIDLQTSQR